MHLFSSLFLHGSGNCPCLDICFDDNFSVCQCNAYFSVLKFGLKSSLKSIRTKLSNKNAFVTLQFSSVFTDNHHIVKLWTNGKHRNCMRTNWRSSKKKQNKTKQNKKQRSKTFKTKLWKKDLAFPRRLDTKCDAKCSALTEYSSLGAVRTIWTPGTG